MIPHWSTFEKCILKTTTLLFCLVLQNCTLLLKTCKKGRVCLWNYPHQKGGNFERLISWYNSSGKVSTVWEHYWNISHVCANISQRKIFDKPWIYWKWSSFECKTSKNACTSELQTTSSTDTKWPPVRHVATYYLHIYQHLSSSIRTSAIMVIKICIITQQHSRYMYPPLFW